MTKIWIWMTSTLLTTMTTVKVVRIAGLADRVGVIRAMTLTRTRTTMRSKRSWAFILAADMIVEGEVKGIDRGE